MEKHHIALFPNDHFLDIRPYQYGWEECAPLHSFGPFVRNHYLFHYIISGRGMLYSHTTSGGISEYSLEANQGFLICPGQINLYTADEKDPWKYVWIEFDGMKAEECLLQAGLERDQPIYRPRSVEEGERLRDQMLYFYENSARSPMHLVGKLSLFLDELIELSSDKRDIGEQTQRDFYINEAVVYIQQNYHRDLTVDEVAGFCKLNRKRRLTMVNTPLSRALGVRNQIFHSNDTRSAVAWTWERMMSATCRRSSKSMLSQFPRWEDRYSIFCGETLSAFSAAISFISP